jgi:hypothetical protein
MSGARRRSGGQPRDPVARLMGAVKRLAVGEERADLIPGYSTANRPDPTLFKPGSQIYVTDLGVMQWSDGRFWRDWASTFPSAKPIIKFSDPPAPGPVHEGDAIAFFGTGIANITQVLAFAPGAIVCNFQIISSTQINVTVPPGTAGATISFQFDNPFGVDFLPDLYNVVLVLTAYEQLCIADGAALLFAFKPPTISNGQKDTDLVAPGTGKDIQIFGPPPVVTPGIVKDCPHAANGVSFADFMQMGGGIVGSSGGDTTLEFIFKFHNVPSTGGTTAQTNDAGDLFHGGPYAAMFDVAGNAVYRYNPSGIDLTTPGAFLESPIILIETRYHMTFVYRAGNAEIWINGVLAAGPFAIAAGAQAVFQMVFGFADQWDCVINELAYYNLALSPAQILAHYNAGLP